jgi:toxin-antitoxin system PIN domain toxin
VIIPDINILVYAYNADAPHHARARRWWEDALSGVETIGLPWVVCLGFLRLMTSRSVLMDPWPAPDVISIIREWLGRPQTQVLQPGSRHLDILESFASQHVLTSNLTTDAHLAALAVEHQATICSNDSDFDRFPGVRRRNPLAAAA